MKTTSLTEHIRTNGLYQSTKKVSGEIHAACFLYSASWTYLRFLTNTTIHIFNSQYDLTKIEELKNKGINIQKLIDKNEHYNINEENWCDGTFTFTRKLEDNEEISLYGHFRKNIFGEQELLLVDVKNYADSFQFIEFQDNYKLEYEYLNYFNKNKYLAVNSLPTFGHSEIDNAFVFQKLTNEGLIKQSGTHHLDCFDFIRTEKGEKYLAILKDKIRGE